MSLHADYLEITASSRGELELYIKTHGRKLSPPLGANNLIQPCTLQSLNFIFGSFMSHPTGTKLFVWLILMGYHGSPG